MNLKQALAVLALTFATALAVSAASAASDAANDQSASGAVSDQSASGAVSDQSAEEPFFLPNETQDETDLRLGPWLDLRGGGVAIGSAQGAVTTNPDGTTTGAFGSLVNASILSRKGVGFQSVSSEDESAGTGFMISLIENSAAWFNSVYPNITIRVGDIAKRDGGYFYPPHKSHQNGLDADILFMGAKSWQSVLDDEGKVTARFDFTKNWEYWRGLVNQKIAVNGREESIVSMILVAPEIKQALCEWTAANNMQSDPLDNLVLRTLRPTAGHDDHFHIRLKCSPYHTQCTGSFSPPKQTGC